MTVALFGYTRVKSSFAFTESSQMQEHIGLTEWAAPAFRELTAMERLVRDNQAKRAPELEDAYLVTGDLLPRLIAESRQVPPSEDWERDLYEP